MNPELLNRLNQFRTAVVNPENFFAMRKVIYNFICEKLKAESCGTASFGCRMLEEFHFDEDDIILQIFPGTGIENIIVQTLNRELNGRLHGFIYR